MTGNEVSGLNITNIDTAEAHTSACGGTLFSPVFTFDDYTVDAGNGTDCITSAIVAYDAITPTTLPSGPQSISLVRSPVELFADDFNRANAATLGPNYATQLGAISHSVVSNQCDHPTLGGINANTRTAESAPSDQYAQATLLATPGASDLAYVMLRTNNAGPDGYGFGYDNINFGNNNLRIVSITGGAITSILADGSHDAAAGDVIRGQVIGTQLKIFQNGLLRLTATNSDFATGQWALRSFFLADTPVFDDFSGGSA